MLPARPSGELEKFSFCRLEQGSVGDDVVNLGLFGRSFCQRFSRRPFSAGILTLGQRQSATSFETKMSFSGQR